MDSSLRFVAPEPILSKIRNAGRDVRRRLSASSSYVIAVGMAAAITLE